MLGSKLPTNAPSTIAYTASSPAPSVSGARKAKLRRLLDFSVRTAAPANLRKSEEEKFLALPPPSSSNRFALSLAGLCSSVVSKILPVTSPLAITSVAASRNALSLLATKVSFLSFSPRSSTIATRHSDSTSAGAEKERLVFIVLRFQYPLQDGESATCEFPAGGL